MILLHKSDGSKHSDPVIDVLNWILVIIIRLGQDPTFRELGKSKLC